MKLNTAISAIIDQAHANSVRNHIAIPGWENPPTRDEVATGQENIRIAATVGSDLVSDLMYDMRDELVFGTFDNCREYGLTVTVSGWTFAVYEHRNSDNICVEGCPTDETEVFGPYGGEDKYDVLFTTEWRNYEVAAKALAAGLRLAASSSATWKRESFKKAMAATVAAV
jgi:hypothetical protein